MEANEITEPTPPDKTPVPDGPMPSLTESLVVLGLLVIAMIGCWVLYGPLIGLMLQYVRKALGA